MNFDMDKVQAKVNEIVDGIYHERMTDLSCGVRCYISPNAPNGKVFVSGTSSQSELAQWIINDIREEARHRLHELLQKEMQDELGKKDVASVSHPGVGRPVC